MDIKSSSTVKESLIVCHNSQGVEIRASLLRVTRHQAVFEFYNPQTSLRISEVLTDFAILFNDRPVFSGRAVITGLVNTGVVVVCEASLNEGWADIDFTSFGVQGEKLREELGDFIQQWQKLYKVLPEYKLIVADMHTFLSELRLWLDQVELGIRSSPSGDRWQLEQQVIEEVAKPVIPAINVFFEKFEAIVESIEHDLLPAHRAYMKRQLHPIVLCSPFAYRTFTKPLGYAGDYEMVNMLVRSPYEGSTLFAKIVNLWFIKQPPAEAHRNRVVYLTQKLLEETLRISTQGKTARIFNVACGPGVEVQRFLSEQRISDQTHFTMLDFNDETLQHVGGVLSEIKNKHHRCTPIKLLKKSVHHLLKESGKAIERSPHDQYDFVYCAGLFDYLPDAVCKRLMSIFYDWLAPGGLLISTNVDISNPLRHGMDHLLDWHLVYRNSSQAQALFPAQAPADAASIRSDLTGVNLLVEVRKPLHV
jgi:extracellular factor (EF) 3-hydroxypalmitic acid methyl ester biosynthesis protein